VWALLCFGFVSSVIAQATESKASLQAQDSAAQTQYAQALKICATKLAPAQCQRQATLDFKTAKHDIALKRDALATQVKRDKYNKEALKKANNSASGKLGNAPDGSALARPPLVKQSPQKKSTPVAMSKQMPVKPAAKKQPLAKKGAPPKGVHPAGSLSRQPTPDQRRANLAKFAANEQAVAARQTQTSQKQSKRQTKDNARRAAGFVVDKP
jgi:hypothetical protein